MQTKIICAVALILISSNISYAHITDAWVQQSQWPCIQWLNINKNALSDFQNTDTHGNDNQKFTRFISKICSMDVSCSSLYSFSEDLRVILISRQFQLPSPYYRQQVQHVITDLMYSNITNVIDTIYDVCKVNIWSSMTYDALAFREFNCEDVNEIIHYDETSRMFKCKCKQNAQCYKNGTSDYTIVILLVSLVFAVISIQFLMELYKLFFQKKTTA